MRTVFDDIWERGYALASDHPELVEAEVRDSLAKEAQRVGLTLSYDARTQSATFVRAGQEPAYGIRERVAILNAWLFLVFRAQLNVTVDQGEQWLRLTEEGSRVARADERMSLTAGRLQSSFPNLYPREVDAQAALSNLERKRLIRSEDDGGIRTYYAEPLLAHVVDQRRAIALVGGHLRGEYAHLMPREPALAGLGGEILNVIQSLPERSVTIETLSDRLGKPRKVVRAEVERLRTAGLVVRHKEGARGGTYGLAERVGGGDA